MSDVVVVGSVNLDLVVEVPHLAAPGETVLGPELHRATGGKGANQAVAAARLGGSVSLFAAVGDDAAGAETIRTLDAEGVDLAHVRVLPGMTTGHALIAVDPDGRNTIVVAAGANARLDIDPTALTDCLREGTTVLLQLEVPLQTSAAAANAARAAGARVVLNAAPMIQDDRDLDRLLGDVDVLVVNQHEALALCPGMGQDWDAIARRLLDLGPAASVVTLGPAGAVAADGQARWHEPAPAVEVVDTTGAGDAFCGVLALALARGDDLATAVKHGCVAGALACTGHGAVPRGGA